VSSDLDYQQVRIVLSLQDLKARARILISGLVQGVLFRRELTDTARRLGASGWVRNLPDGRVEAVAEGDKEKLDALVRFCNVGPPGARVSDLDVEWSEFKGEFRGFKITHQV
jgi:acylphosphatase